LRDGATKGFKFILPLYWITGAVSRRNNIGRRLLISAKISYMHFLLWGVVLLVVNLLSNIRLGTGDLAKYPFLKEASEYIRLIQLDYEEFDRPEMKFIIERSAQRLEGEVNHGKHIDALERYEIEVLTFLVCLMMVKCIGIDTISKRHSLFEALRAERLLGADLKKERNEDRRQLLISKIFVELFGVRVEINEDDHRLFKVKVNDYLARASKFHEQEWKLINRSVHKGYVYLDADETVRLIRNELSTLIYNRINEMNLSAMPESVKLKLLGVAPKFGRGYYTANIQPISGYPPCVKHAIDEMSKGENLSHSARILLATYMLSIGKNIDEIASLFHTAPDYDEKVTRYQIEHLAGKKGSGTKYFVPSCEKVINENLCFATKECAGIVNPFQFGRGLRKKVE
jgi:DNA primase large subunit